MIVFNVWVILRIYDAAFYWNGIIAFLCLRIYGLLNPWTDWTFESYFGECFLAPFVYSIHGAQLGAFESQSLVLVQHVSLSIFMISILISLMSIWLLDVLLLILPLNHRNILILLLFGILLFVLLLDLIISNNNNPRELAALFIIILFLYIRNLRFLFIRRFRLRVERLILSHHTFVEVNHLVV